MTAFLRPAGAALIAALAARAIRYEAHLYTITLIDGVTTYTWTDFDKALTSGGTAFTPWPLGRPAWNVVNTMEVPSLTLKVLSLNAAFGAGAPLQQQIHAGLFDGATLAAQMCPMGADANPATLGTVPFFTGKIAGIDCDGVAATIAVKGKVNDLDQYAPRNLYRTTCNHAFCDAGCTLSRAAYTASFAVGASPTATFIPWASAPGNAATYQNGTIAITSGAAAGSRRSIAAASASGLTLAYPLATVPAPGDTFTAFQGCDKTLNSGSAQSCTAYANTAHFRGFTNVPPPGAAY